MSGTIRTYQKCPKCGEPFSSSKGTFPIICQNGCQTQPTKFFISIKWNGKREKILRDRDGRTIHDWGHAVAVIGEVRSRMSSHKSGKGFFDPNTYKKQSDTAFSAFWERFEKKYKDATLDKIKAVGKHHMTYFHEYQMRDILPWHIDQWWQGITDKNLSSKYMADILTWARAFFKYAFKLEIIERVPAILEDITVDAPEPEVEDWFTSDIQLAVLTKIPQYDHPIFEFLFLTGCRVNEACALQTDDIHVEKQQILINNTIKRNGSIGQVKNKKTRRIPYQGSVKQCISDALQRRGLGVNFVFINKWGRHYTDDYLRDIFYEACDKAEVRRIKLKNATRHSFGMRMLQGDYDIWQVSKALCHSDIKMTEHYVKVLDKELEDAYEMPKSKGAKRVPKAKRGKTN